MPEPIKRGTDEPLLQFSEASWSLNQGGRSTQEWKGLNVSKMSAKAAAYAAGGWDGTLRFEHDVATLNLTTGNVQIPGLPNVVNEITDRWEVAVDQERPELYQNETFLSIVRANDANTIGVTGKIFPQSLQLVDAIRRALAQADSTQTILQNLKKELGSYLILANGKRTQGEQTVDLNINVTGESPNLMDFVTDLMFGRTNFLRGKYSLRHTTIAPSNYHENVADFNVEKGYSIAQLLSEAKSTSLWILPLPGYLEFKIKNYPEPAAMLPNYQFGALKTRSNAVLAARGRIEITTEYLIDAWAIHTYGLAT